MSTNYSAGIYTRCDDYVNENAVLGARWHGPGLGAVGLSVLRNETILYGRYAYAATAYGALDRRPLR